MRQDMDFSKNLGEARQVLADLQEAGSVFSAGGERQLDSFRRKWKIFLAQSEDATKRQLMFNIPLCLSALGYVFQGPVDALHPCSGVGEVLASRRNEEVERKPWGPTKQHRPNVFAAAEYAMLWSNVGLVIKGGGKSEDFFTDTWAIFSIACCFKIIYCHILESGINMMLLRITSESMDMLNSNLPQKGSTILAKNARSFFYRMSPLSLIVSLATWNIKLSIKHECLLEQRFLFDHFSMFYRHYLGATPFPTAEWVEGRRGRDRLT